MPVFLFINFYLHQVVAFLSYICRTFISYGTVIVEVFLRCSSICKNSTTVIKEIKPNDSYIARQFPEFFKL